MNRNYAGVYDRMRAAFIDAIIFIGAIYAVSELFALFDDVPTYLRIIAFVLIFLLYDPIFISVYGGTIGHSYNKLQVKRDDDTGKNISFPLALVRFFVKVTLGWISLLTITGNDKKKAIHDYIVNSVVIDGSEQ